MLLNEMEIFYQVVKNKSFSRAAEELEVSKSYISKRITKLEKTLKTRLLNRSTRRLVLTEVGEKFYLTCAQIIQEADQGYKILQDLQGKATGTLKISAPPAVGFNIFASFIPDFMSKYPDVNLDIRLESKLIDVIKHGYDLVLRSAPLKSSNLISQKLLSFRYVICGTEDYFKAYGIPKVPSELEHHNFALYSESKNSKYISLNKNHKEYKVTLQGNFSSNQLDFIKKILLRGSCLALIPEFMISKELSNKEIIPCLETYVLAKKNLYLIYPDREFMPLKVKVFISMLKKCLKTYKGF